MAAAVFNNLIECGSILSNKEYNYFALRCVKCKLDADAPTFGQWPSFVLHLKQKHAQKVQIKPDDSSDESTDFKDEHFDVTESDAYLHDTSIKAESDVEEEVLEQIFDEVNQEDVLQQVELLPEEFQAEDEEFHQVEFQSEEVEEEQEVDIAKEKIKTPGVKIDKFMFNNRASVSNKKAALQYLKCLQAHTLLWDATNEHHHMPYMRTKALIEIKDELQKAGYDVAERVLRNTTRRVLSDYKEAQQKRAINGFVPARLDELYKLCSFMEKGTAKTTPTRVSQRANKGNRSAKRIKYNESSDDEIDQGLIKDEANEEIAEFEVSLCEDIDGSEYDNGQQLTLNEAITHFLDNNESDLETHVKIETPQDFTFGLLNPTTREMSIKFLRLLKNKSVLWNTNHADHDVPYARTKALLEIKSELQKLGITSSDRILRNTVRTVLSDFNEAKQKLSQNSDLSDSEQQLLKACSFIKPKVERKSPIKNVKKEHKELVDADDDNDETFNESDEEMSSDDSVDADKPAIKKALKLEKQRRNYNLYKRMQFRKPNDPVVVEFIKLIRDNPVLWGNPRVKDRRNILENWIDVIKERTGETFTCDDFLFNLRVLRSLVLRIHRRELDDPASLFIKEKCNFLPVIKREVNKCEECNKTFYTEINYKAHMFSKHKIGETPYKCEECNAGFSCLANYEVHMANKHTQKFNLRCNICDRGFLRQCELDLHMPLHTGKMKFICAICGRGFRKRTNLNNHETRIHLRQRNFPCEYCPKSFYTKALLKDHTNVHLNLRPHVCSTCGKAFHSCHSLIRHRQIHSEIKKYVCKLCDARFHQFVGLNAHMKNRHKFVPGDGEQEAPRATTYDVEEVEEVDIQISNDYIQDMTLARY